MNGCEDKYKILMSGYIDGELTPQEKSDFENHLRNCGLCQKEMDTFQKLREVTGAMKYADIPEHVWRGYWKSLYRRMELGVGWILVSIAAVILLGYTLFEITRGFFLNPGPPILLKIAVGIGGLGLIILLVSTVRERVFAYNRDRYKEIQR
jgi:predicted anti-sigma-YlaC factor YlaD